MEKGTGIRVLELPSWYLPEGGQFVLHQAKALQERGAQVHILANVTLYWRKYKWQMLNPVRYPLTPFYTTENGILHLRHFHRAFPKAGYRDIERWAQQTARLFDRYQQQYGCPDILHVHSGTWAAYAASLIKEIYHVPYVVTEHRGVFGCRSALAQSFFVPEITPYLTKGYSHADALLPVSDQLIPKMSGYLNRDVPFHVVSNIVDTDFFRPASYPKQQKVFRWVSVNGFYPVKGYDILLPAFDRLCDLAGDVELRIVGENFHLASFQSLLNRCRNKSKIRFTGELTRDGVLHELQQADAFVLPSRVESESVAVLEALSCGLPVAATDVVPEYVLPPECGLRVPVEQAETLATAMQHIMQHFRQYQPNTIRKHVESIARKDVVAKQLTDIFNLYTNRL